MNGSPSGSHSPPLPVRDGTASPTTISVSPVSMRRPPAVPAPCCAAASGIAAQAPASSPSAAVHSRRAPLSHMDFASHPNRAMVAARDRTHEQAEMTRRNPHTETLTTLALLVLGELIGGATLFTLTL